MFSFLLVFQSKNIVTKIKNKDQLEYYHRLSRCLQNCPDLKEI